MVVIATAPFPALCDGDIFQRREAVLFPIPAHPAEEIRELPFRGLVVLWLFRIRQVQF